MQRISICFLLILFYFNSTLTYAQSAVKVSTVLYKPNIEIQLDSLCIAAQTVKVLHKGAIVSSNDYFIDAINGRIRFLRNRPDTCMDSVKVFYQTYEFSKSISLANQTYQSEEAILNRQRLLYANLYTNNKPIAEEYYSGIETLNRTGFIARGFSVGNNQSLSVNSALNFQINGSLPNGFDIAAAITDDNLPFQASGATQQLQEFDKVFIQITKQKNKIIAGDFQQENTQNYFLKYNKRLQGLYTSINNETKKINLTNEIGIAVSRGKFARNIIQGIEGNQGPYKLRGAENEGCIIILSGTERVYVDGILLVRGQENDYAIDYNTAEIVFTPKRLITKDRRIIVEFQYADKNYLRSMIIYTGELQFKKQQVYWNYYNERDNKNRPVQQNLSDIDKLTLQNAGNNLQLAQTLRADSVAFNPNAILYKKLDTVVNGILYPNIFEYSTNPSNANFQLSFSNVGINNGNYIQEFKNGNGITFKWIAPINGISQGGFEPIIQLIAPKKREMLSLGSNLQLAKNTTFQAELALSNKDENTFSTIDDNKNIDLAHRISLTKKINYAIRDTQSYFLLQLSQERQNSYFAPIERYRSIEFERDWNLNTNLNQTRQQVQKVTLTHKLNSKGASSYTLGALTDGLVNKGIQQKLENKYQTKNLLINATSMLTNLKRVNDESKFARTRWNANFYTKNIKWISLADIERNVFSPITSNDSLLNNSYQFIDYSLGVGNADTASLTWNLLYNNRYDYKTDKNNLETATVANAIGASTAWQITQNQLLKFTGNFRKLLVNTDLIKSKLPEQTLLYRAEHIGKWGKGFITNNVFFESGSGLEQRRAFSFLQVGAGQGVYFWNDYNDNNVKELSEFEISQFPDQAQYVKVFTLTNDYTSVYNNVLSTTLNINGGALPKRVHPFVKKWSNQFYLRLDLKTQKANSITQLFSNKNFIIGSNSVEDTNTVSSILTYRNTLFYNASGKLGTNFSILQNSGKSLLADGYDYKGVQQYTWGIRYNISNVFTLNNEVIQSLKIQQSDFISQRNYRIAGIEVEPKLTFQQSAIWQLQLGVRYSDKKESTQQLKALLQRYFIEARYSTSKLGSINAKFSFLAIKYNGSESNAIAFELLESLNAGNNFTWQVYWQQNLSKNLQLNLIYDARKAAGIDKIINTGNIQLRALF